MDAGSVILIVLLGILVVGAATAVTVAILVYKVLKRVASRPLPGVVKARRSVLKVRATAGNSSARELASLRLALQDSLAATFRSLQAAKTARQHLGRLEQIVENLNHAAGELEGQLKVAQKDPDRRIREVYAQTLGVHVQQILETSTGVRKALAASAQPIVAVGLGELTRKLDVETAMLANWSRTYQQLGQPEYFLGFPAVPDSAKQSPADKQPRPHNYRKGAA